MITKAMRNGLREMKLSWFISSNRKPEKWKDQFDSQELEAELLTGLIIERGYWQEEAAGFKDPWLGHCVLEMEKEEYYILYIFKFVKINGNK